ncbi:MAG TPA: spermidine synthase, partial [Romboutsia sp.]|nr:spermidine synthase [Romboutsia sp.]
VNQCESPFYEKNAKEMRKSVKKIKSLFPISKIYQYNMPTYPSGHWLFGFASKKYDPIKDFNPERWEALGLETRYYDRDVHIGSFMLPAYVKKMIETVDKK